MDMFWDILISLLLVIGGFFGLVGSYGLVKLPDQMTRLHAPTKAATLGVGACLIASMIYFATKEGHLSFHELMITVFLFLTAPITAYFIAKANLLRNVKRENLPRPEGSDWAVYTPLSDTARGELDEAVKIEQSRAEDVRARKRKETAYEGEIEEDFR